MYYKKEIDECLKILQLLKGSFQSVNGEERLTLSFFSENHDLMNELKSKLNQLEALQFRKKEEEAGLLQLTYHPLVSQEDAIKQGKGIISEKREREKEVPENIIIQYQDKNVEMTEIKGSLGDKIGKRLFADIRSSLSLNDKFRFQRDLFYGKSDLMNRTLDHLNDLHSIEEALIYLQQHFSWDWENESVNAFKEILENRFS